MLLPFSQRNINILKDLFSGIAIINTHYLKAKSNLKSDEFIIDKSLKFNNVLPVAKKTGEVLLFPVNEDNDKIILIRFKYSKDIYNTLKDDNSLTWDNKNKCFCFPAGNKQLYSFIRKHSDNLKIKIHNQLIINDHSINKLLFEQHYLKTITFKSCPDEFLKKLVNDKYSRNTISTYYYYLLRFLNTYQQSTLKQICEFDSDIISGNKKTPITSLRLP